MIARPFNQRYGTPAQLEAMQTTIPMNRRGSPEQRAGTFIDLAPDELSGYLTGQLIEVNGGQSCPSARPPR